MIIKEAEETAPEKIVPHKYPFREYFHHLFLLFPRVVPASQAAAAAKDRDRGPRRKVVEVRAARPILSGVIGAACDCQRSAVAAANRLV